MDRTITAKNRATFQVFTFRDPGELSDWDSHGYDIAYFVEERNQLTGDALCAGCAKTFLDGLDPEFDDETGLYVAYQINGEIGDRESVYCDDCHGIIYAGEDLDYDKSKAA